LADQGRGIDPGGRLVQGIAHVAVLVVVGHHGAETQTGPIRAAAPTQGGRLVQGIAHVAVLGVVGNHGAETQTGPIRGAASTQAVGLSRESPTWPC